jgi:hypothetical protein
MFIPCRVDVKYCIAGRPPWTTGASYLPAAGGRLANTSLKTGIAENTFGHPA